MNSQFVKLFEIGFDLFYLIFIWVLVIKMYTGKRGQIRNTGKLFRLALLFLAIGDTGHVGFRVWAYLSGGLDSVINIFSMELKLIGVGALLTAYFVTFFYMLVAKAWYERFNKRNAVLYYFLQALAIFRLIIMAFPHNQWGGAVIPYNWSMYRNLPLIVMGLVLATKMLFDAKKERDSVFKKLSMYIFVSYLFYMPVIFWVRFIPMLGMLMIPKTVAYLFMAVLVYRTYFKDNAGTGY